MRDVHADAGVAGARASGDKADPGIPRHLAVGFGHVRCAGLVTARHEADALCVINSVENLEVALARHTECRVDAMRFQCVDEDSPAGSCL